MPSFVIGEACVEFRPESTPSPQSINRPTAHTQTKPWLITSTSGPGPAAANVRSQSGDWIAAPATIALTKQRLA